MAMFQAEEALFNHLKALAAVLQMLPCRQDVLPLTAMEVQAYPHPRGVVQAMIKSQVNKRLH